MENPLEVLFDTRYLQALVLEPCFLFDLTTASLVYMLLSFVIFCLYCRAQSS